MNSKRLLVLILSAILLLSLYGCKKEGSNNKTTGSDAAISNQAGGAVEKSISNSYDSMDQDIIHEKNLTEQNGWVYYHNPDDSNSLYKRNTDGSRNIKLSDSIIGPFCLDGEWIYYNDYKENSLCRIKTDGSSKEKLASDQGFSINVSKEWIYYINSSDNNKPYKVKKDGTSRTKLSEDYARNIYAAGGDWVYYISESDNSSIYVIGMDGRERSKVTNKPAYYLCVSEGWLYYQPNNIDNMSLYKIKKDGTEETCIASGNPSDVITQLEVSGDYIYYHVYNSDDSLYRVRKDGTDLIKLSSEGEHIGIFDVSEDGLFFISTFYSDKIYKMGLDSKKETKIGKLPAFDSKHLAEWLLYNDKQNTLGLDIIKDDKKDYVPLMDRATSNIKFIEDTAYFLVKSGDSNNLFKFGAGDTKPQILAQGNILTYDIAGDFIYFYDSVEHTIFRIKADGTEKTHISNINVHDIQVNGEWIYYTMSSNGIYRMKVNGTENHQLASGVNSFESFKISGDWIYYSENMGLSKIKTDGTEKTRICDLPEGVGPIYLIKNGRLYYDNIFAEGGGYYNWFNGLYSIKLEGTDKQTLLKATFKTWAVDEDYAYYSKVERDINLIRTKLDGNDRKIIIANFGWN